MVKAELKYNPYLLETVVSFNNESPRVNSLVEKYMGSSLHTWIDRIPKIFYDEMNGYDFELDFSGTERDYAELKKVFDSAGVSEDQVQLVHTNKLEDRSIKTRQIDALMRWLAANPNRWFKYERFAATHKELFEGAYRFIVVQGPALDNKLDGLDISSENIDSVDELQHTDLTGTAILMYVQPEQLSDFQENLKALLKRNDVIQEQLFFLIHADLEQGNIQRIIQDIGIPNPQMISDINDECVRSYMELYPVSDFIRSAICVFEEQTQELQAVLTKENRKSAIVNHTIHSKIDALDAKIRSIKSAMERFQLRKDPVYPLDWFPTRSSLENSLMEWKNRKTKMNSEHEALLSAQEFDRDLEVFFSDFGSTLTDLANEYERTTAKTFVAWYQETGFSVPDEVYSITLQMPCIINAPNLSYDLLRLKHEQKVQPKEAIWGLLFQKQPAEPAEEVTQTVYYYQEWRKFALEKIMPLADDLMEHWQENFRQYERRLIDFYMEFLQQLLEQKTAAKNEASAQLSEDEQLLQDDNDWLAEFCSQLQMIERG